MNIYAYGDDGMYGGETESFSMPDGNYTKVKPPHENCRWNGTAWEDLTPIEESAEEATSEPVAGEVIS